MSISAAIHEQILDYTLSFCVSDSHDNDLKLGSSAAGTLIFFDRNAE